MEHLRDFCERQHYGPERGFLLPCREFILVTVSHLAIMLYSVITLTQYFFTPPPQIAGAPSNPPIGSLFFSLASTASLVTIACQMAIPFGRHHHDWMPPVLLIAYSLAITVLLTNAIAHFAAYFRQRHLALLPFVPSAIPVLIFLLISTQRWISFGPSDPRTLLTFLLLLFQTASAMLTLISGKILHHHEYAQQQDWSQLDDDVQRGHQRPLVYAEGRGQHTSWIPHIFSQLFFCWTNPLLQKGYRRELKQVDDVFELPASLNLTTLERVLLLPPIADANDDQQQQRQFSFAPALLRHYGRPFALLGLLRLVGDCLKFASPILLHLLITSLQEPIAIRTGYACSALMFATMFLASLCDFHFNYHIGMLNMRAKTALLLAVYAKLLRIPAHRLSDDFSSGKLINLMCTDVDRIGGFIASFHAFWSMPMNFGIALYLLYREIGPAFLAGLAASLLLIPLNKHIATKIGHFSNKMMRMKDARMKLVNELAHSMRTVKLNNWEQFFEAKIAIIRAKELAHLKAIKYLDAVCVYLWASAPIVITLLMLVTFTAVLHEQLTAAKVFTILALINILIMPLNAFPWVLSSMINGLVSKRRFDSFFAIKSTPAQMAYCRLENIKDAGGGGETAQMPPPLLRLNGNSFGWMGGEDGQQCQPAVSNIHFAGQKGSLIGIVGPVGAGKSTLLAGIPGETRRQGPPIQIDDQLAADGFAYVGQDVWLRAGTIRQNILCERPFREDRFRAAIEACALRLDIEGMPGGDAYRISGEGITLSGGQKVRLALARALYADKPVYLLDDPYAALDRQVARHVHEHCVEAGLRANGKLVIVATHHEQFLHDADLVIRLAANGEVEQIGTAEEVLSVNGQARHKLDEDAEEGAVQQESPMEAAEFVGAAEEEAEEKEEGAVHIRVYRTYLRAIGQWMGAGILVAILAMQFSKNASDIWLSRWASKSGNSSTTAGGTQIPNNGGIHDWRYPFSSRPIVPIADESAATTTFYLSIYISIAALNSLFTILRAFLFAFGCILAARRLHQRLLARILRASISWWDRTPCGRVTNRLSSDVAMVDDSLPFQLNIFLASLFSLIGTLLITIVALPLLAPLILLLFVLYFFIQRYYRRTTVELKRITALTLSPLYSHLAETVSGLVSIRAFRITDNFSTQMRHLVGQSLRAQFSSLACSQWLSVRIQSLGVAIVTAIAVASVLDVSLFRMASPGLIGLAITYALSLTNVLNGILTSFIETEKELVSVERICDYAENVPTEGGEAEEEAGKNAVDQILCRRINGQIRFTGVSLRYGPELPLAIRDVSFQIEAGQRVAIIGRTGSGKSTILQALLRAHPIETGKIHIDDVIDLHSLGLKMARSLFGFVSQHPFLFSGTLRDNLCMASQHLEDGQIEAIVAQIGLADWLGQFGGLDAEISEGGRNLSFGERQLICLLRLALSGPKIILIDEATAHMDERTHRLMSRLIGGMGCTLVAILHRLNGIDDHFDWVIEMANGQISRQGPPAEMLFKEEEGEG